MTDIGGLDDRSFNFLANKGLQQAKTKLGVQGRVFISKSNADYVPNLVDRGAPGLQPDHRGRLPDGATRRPRSRSASRSRSSRSSTSRRPDAQGQAEERPRPALQGAGGRLPRRLPRRGCGRRTSRTARRDRLGRRPEDPAGRPLHRRLPVRRQEGVPGRQGRATATRRTSSTRRSARSWRSTRSPTARPSSSRSPASAASARSTRRQGEGRVRDRRRRRPGLPRHHVLTSATKKVDVAVYRHDRAAKATGASSRTGFNAIFTVKNGGVGYGRLTHAGPALVAPKALAGRPGADRDRQDQGHPSRPRRPSRARALVAGGGGVLQPAPSGTVVSMTRRPVHCARCSPRSLAAVLALAGCGSDDDDDVDGGRHDRGEDGGHDRRPAAPRSRIGLVTDIGGLDDRSFNFLANQGLERARTSSASRAASSSPARTPTTSPT